VYAAFASFCDYHASYLNTTPPPPGTPNATHHSSRGWLFGWDASTLTRLSANELTDTQVDSTTHFFLSSIWMSGYGIASDGADIYFATGNSDCNWEVSPEQCPSTSTWDGNKTVPTNIQESVVRLSATDLTTFHGVFSPSNRLTLDQQDADLGSGGVLLLQPPKFPLGLAVAGGKDGRLFVLQRNTPAGLSLLQTLNGSGSCWCGPSYFIGEDTTPRVVTSHGTALLTWDVNNASSPSLSPDGSANVNGSGQDGGFFTSVSCQSADGTTSTPCNSGTAIIWAVGRPHSPGTTVTLYAFKAQADSGTLTNLYKADFGSWPHTGGNANIVPVVANGKVYVVSNKQLAIFGLTTGVAAVATAGKAPDQGDVANLPYKHVKSGMVESFDGTILILDGRGQSRYKIDASQAILDGQVGTPLVAGVVVTAVSNLQPKGGILPAEAIFRAKGKGDKSDPEEGDLWPPDQDEDNPQ
jgi:hypothetical protein